MSELIRRGLIQADYVPTYEALQARLDERVRSCTELWSSNSGFRQFNPEGWPTPQWGRAGGGIAATQWSDCLKGRAAVPGTNPPVIDTTWTTPQFCIDEPATPYLDYERCQPVSVHRQGPSNGNMPERDRVLSNIVSQMMGIPTHDQVVDAYGSIPGFPHFSDEAGPPSVPLPS